MDYKEFIKRWNIPIDERDIFIKIKTSIINVIIDKLNDIWNTDLDFQFCKKAIVNIVPGTHFLKMKDSYMYREFSKVNNLIDLLRYVECLLEVLKKKPIYENFMNDLKEVIDGLPINVNLSETRDGIIFYPKGAKLLDEELVDDVLDWLDTFPDVKTSFKSALEKYQAKVYQRNLLDDLRLAYETLLKQVLNSNKNLDKLKDPFFKHIKYKKVPKEIGNMYWILTNHYSEYQNRYVKHNDKVDEKEIEFIIYLTATFIRYLLILQEENK